MSDRETIVAGLADVIADHLKKSGGIAVDEFGVKIDHIGFDAGDPEIWLRTTEGEAWILRVYRLGSFVPDEHHVGKAQVLESYRAFRRLLEHVEFATRTATILGVEDGILQSIYEDQFDDEARAIWDLWSPGGKATSQEWNIVQG